MKRYRKFESWLADVRKQLNHPTLEGRGSDLYSMSWGFTVFDEQLRDDVGRVRELIAVMRQLRDGRGVGRAMFEEHVMQGLSWLVQNACTELLDGGVAQQPLHSVPESLAPDLRPVCEVVVEICNYAMDCLTFSRSRDSLAGNRRRYAMELLGEASCVFEMPESVFAFVRQTLKTGRRPAALGAILFCETYYKARDLRIPDDVEALLLAFAERTDSRGLAVGALNTLVESGNICELTALDHIDDWKDRNYPGRRPPQEEQ